MKLSEYLKERGILKAEVARITGVTLAAVSQWGEIPGKHCEKLRVKPKEDLPKGVTRDWWIWGETLFWSFQNPNGTREVREYGHGNVFDYNYSPAKIEFIKGLLKQLGSVPAVIEWVAPVEFEREFVEGVDKGVVCPKVVEMRAQEGGRPIPIPVFPFGEHNAEET